MKIKISSMLFITKECEGIHPNTSGYEKLYKVIKKGLEHLEFI
jgi:hypothetical protein